MKDYIRLFADDTVSTVHGGDLSLLVEQIRQSFENLYRWCVCNELTTNSDKTNFVLFHTINKPMPTNLNEISMEFMTVQRVKTFKYLGITLDETLNWGEHAEAICSSLLKYVGIIYQIKSKVTTRVVRQIYFAFIYSRMKCGIEVYGNYLATNLNKIQVMQNKLMKLLLNIDRLTPTDTLHQTLNMLKVSDIYQVNILSFVNDTVSGRWPNLFQDYFELIRNTYDLRTKGQIIVLPARIVFGDKQIRIKGAHL